MVTPDSVSTESRVRGYVSLKHRNTSCASYACVDTSVGERTIQITVGLDSVRAAGYIKTGFQFWKRWPFFALALGNTDSPEGSHRYGCYILWAFSFWNIWH